MNGLSCRAMTVAAEEMLRGSTLAVVPPRRIMPVREASRPADCFLTRRQLECLRWAGEGKSSVDIGGILDISAATVNEHLTDACRRLGVRTRVQAIVESYRRGWLE